MRAGTRAAFTLIEMIVVLAIMGVTIGVVIPALARTVVRTDRSRQSADSVIALIARTRDQAMRSGEHAAVIIDPRDHTFWVLIGTEDSVSAHGNLALPEGARLLSAVPRPRFDFDQAGFGTGAAVTTIAEGRAVAIDLLSPGGEPVITGEGIGIDRDPSP